MSRIQFLLAITVSSALVSVACADSSLSGIPGRTLDANPENISLHPLAAADSSNVRTSSTRTPTTGRTMTTVVGGLAICLGVFFLFVWVTKRHGPTGWAPLPKEVVESLGRAPLSGRQQLQLLRVGRKLVLLNVTATTVKTLTEITDPLEVERLVGLCHQTAPNSVTASFRDVLAHYESEPAAPGFLGEAGQSDWELATRGGRKRPSHREEVDG
jgi:flagellar biogenesis protein FliO